MIATFDSLANPDFILGATTLHDLLLEVLVVEGPVASETPEFYTWGHLRLAVLANQLLVVSQTLHFAFVILHCVTLIGHPLACLCAFRGRVLVLTVMMRLGSCFVIVERVVELLQCAAGRLLQAEAPCETQAKQRSRTTVALLIG